MRELREDTFSKNKNDDAHEHVRRVLDIVSLFNILGVSHDAVMLHVFPITLTGAVKRWVDRLPPGTVDSWDFLKKPLSKGIVHLQRLSRSLKISITLSRKEMKHYTKLGNGAMNRQFLDLQGPIPGMTPVQALTAIQIMVDHSQKWHNGSSSRNIETSSNSEGIIAIVNKLENLGSHYEEMEFEVSLTHFCMVERFCIGVTTKVTPYEGGLDLVNPDIRITMLNLGLVGYWGLIIDLDYRLVLRVLEFNHCKLGYPARVIVGEYGNAEGKCNRIVSSEMVRLARLSP
uniref:Reverse transcriptase domain-containing protein n=1 Tax=Tanacetum cinerariifolium TaxID=118510 RepID=A0A699GLR5_TANCI|nr:hypothetical protein [Tanacetum cinerariifolium]